MQPFHHIGNEARLGYYRARRYWAESVAALAATMTVFLGLLYAVTTLGNASLESGKLDALIIGFVLWMFASAAYAGPSSELAEEIRQRSLEQICVAPIPLWMTLGIRTGIKIGSATALLLAMLIGINVVTAGRLQLSYAAMTAILLLASPSLIGLGYMTAGLLLLARKLEALQLLVYPALIGVVAYPAYPLTWGALLPFSLGASMAKLAGRGQVLPFHSYLLLGLTSLAWLLGGLLVFRVLERQARRLGVMGHS